MNLTLPPEIQKLIDERVQSGQFKTREDVVAAAIANLDQQERMSELDAAELEVIFPGFRQKIAEGLAEAEAGKLSDGESFFTELQQED